MSSVKEIMWQASPQLHTRACNIQHVIIALDITRNDFYGSPLERYVKHWFIDVDEFIDRIEDITEDSIILIVSNLLVNITENVLTSLLPQINRVHVLGKPLHKEYCVEFTHEHHLDVASLIQVLVRDEMMSKVITTQCYSTERSFNNLTKECPKYIWFKFFFHILSCLRYTQIALNEMLESVQHFHSEDQQQYVTENCIDFNQNYKPQDIIRWYTRTTFFYVSLNRSLRSEDISNIFNYRYVLLDLQDALLELQEKQPPVKYSIVYRGQQMQLDEVKSLMNKVGSIIVVNTLWPVSPNLLCTEHYAESATRSTPTVLFESVIFIISIPDHLRHSACVDITKFSSYRRLQEMIFPLCSLFRVEKFSKSNRFWHINLTLMDKNDKQYIETISPWKNSLNVISFFTTSVRESKEIFQNLSEDNIDFIRSQLLIDMILRLNRNDYAKHEMLEACREQYSSNSIELEKIDAFEQSYDGKDAVTWYTKDCFLYRLLNKSLKTSNIDLIVKLRYFIYDLHNQLAELQPNFFRFLRFHHSTLTLYRGLTMTTCELNQFRQHKTHFVSINSFLSTTRDYQAALFFSGEGKVNDPRVSVVYEISIDANINHSVPFAAIEYQSIYKDEDEILFSMGAVFCIGKINEISERLWKIRLTLSSPDKTHWNTLIQHLKKQPGPSDY